MKKLSTLTESEVIMRKVKTEILSLIMNDFTSHNLQLHIENFNEEIVIQTFEHKETKTFKIFLFIRNNKYGLDFTYSLDGREILRREFESARTLIEKFRKTFC